jgi:hypothetical protein
MLPATGPLGTALPTGAPAGSRADHPTARPTSPARGKEKLRIADDGARRCPATRQGRLPGGGWLRNDGGRAAAASHNTASATTRICQRHRCARPARHRDEHASQRTCVKSRAPAASSHVAAASAPPCPSVTSGHKTHTAVTNGQERAKRYYGWAGSERPQPDTGLTSRRYPLPSADQGNLDTQRSNDGQWHSRPESAIRPHGRPLSTLLSVIRPAPGSRAPSR